MIATKIFIIVAMDHNNAIGKEGKLLCQLKDDMGLFVAATMGNVVIMGRKTFESIGRPLMGRTNIVLSRDSSYRPEGVVVLHSVEQALEWVKAAKTDVFIIGGAEIYKQFMPHATMMFVSRIDNVFDNADAFFPQVDWNEWELLGSRFFEKGNRNEYPFTFQMYMR